MGGKIRTMGARLVLLVIALALVAGFFVACSNHDSNLRDKVAKLRASEVGQSFQIPGAPYPMRVTVESVDSRPLDLGSIYAKASVRILLPRGSRVLHLQRNDPWRADYYIGLYVVFVDATGVVQSWTFTEVKSWDTGRGYAINRFGEVSASPVE